MLTLVVIALGTLVSEDATCIATGLLIQRGHVGITSGILACLSGIYLGDLGLWALGRLCGGAALQWPWAARRLSHQSVGDARAWLERHAAGAIVSSRFLPGTRFALYVVAGILRLPVLGVRPVVADRRRALDTDARAADGGAGRGVRGARLPADWPWVAGLARCGCRHAVRATPGAPSRSGRRRNADGRKAGALGAVGILADVAVLSSGDDLHRLAGAAPSRNFHRDGRQPWHARRRRRRRIEVRHPAAASAGVDHPVGARRARARRRPVASACARTSKREAGRCR